jgi:quercetin dioxygenase-like cupin family protein
MDPVNRQFEGEESSMTTESSKADLRKESIHSGTGAETQVSPGVSIREFVSAACTARGFSTGTATFQPGSLSGYHKHSFCETLTLLEGVAEVKVEGRSYLLQQFDCMCLPAGVAHAVTSGSDKSPAMLLWACASPAPSQEEVKKDFDVQERGSANPGKDDPESLVRFAEAEVYELSPGALFRDLFAGRLGSVGICGGYGRFQPGGSLPCHVHEYDESITIVEGEALCLVQGNRYPVSRYDTAFVPEGRPHRFLNQSTAPMAMVWVYAGTEPGRTLVEPEYCDGTLAWPQAGI